jgi:hypothetical protein
MIPKSLEHITGRHLSVEKDMVAEMEALISASNVAIFMFN